MPVTVALAGADQSGKTTLFTAVTRGRGHDGVGMVDVPDARLYRLAGAVHPAKVVHAQVRVEDAPLGSRAQRIGAAREADVVVKVVRCFGPDPDPIGELEGLDVDLALADLATVERRLDLVEREVRVGKKERADELEALRAARDHLDRGQGLRTLDLDADRRALLDPLFPVSGKPSVHVANVGDDSLPDGGEAAQRMCEVARQQGGVGVVVCAQLEAELSELEPEEASELRASYGLAEGSLDTLARAIWDAGGLITFFTAGEPEVRAWYCPREAPAPIAAGAIHTDFEKHFIRAEVTSVDELVQGGSMDALRAAAALRIEGRDYRVQDGDVLFFRVGR
jgi:ribosome-binding ATPase